VAAYLRWSKATLRNQLSAAATAAKVFYQNRHHHRARPIFIQGIALTSYQLISRWVGGSSDGAWGYSEMRLNVNFFLTA
jgi:hypothetical protein